MRLEYPEAFGSRTHDSDEPVRRLLALEGPPGSSVGKRDEISREGLF
jgi:hypothetical protein